MTPIDRPFDFRGATALVVGGASGLGRAMAESLAQHGASVCIAARTEEKARTIAAEIAARAGARCESCVADLAAEESVQALGATVDRLFGGRLNIAVNSAGVNVRNRIEAISVDGEEFICAVQWHPEFHDLNDPSLLPAAPIVRERLAGLAAWGQVVASGVGPSPHLRKRPRTP